jgi:hypothetical protein
VLEFCSVIAKVRFTAPPDCSRQPSDRHLGFFLPVFDRSEAIDHLQGRERGVSELLGGCTLAVRELLKSVGPLARRWQEVMPANLPSISHTHQ